MTTPSNGTLFQDCSEEDDDGDLENENNNQQLHECLQELCLEFLNFIIDRVHSTSFGEMLQKSRLYTHTTEAVNTFDAYCRIVFPSSFILSNLIYWLLYCVVL